MLFGLCQDGMAWVGQMSLRTIVSWGKMSLQTNVPIGQCLGAQSHFGPMPGGGQMFLWANIMGGKLSL